MKQETEAKIKYGAWGLILGAGSAMIIGFNWGGWTSSRGLPPLHRQQTRTPFHLSP